MKFGIVHHSIRRQTAAGKNGAVIGGYFFFGITDTVMIMGAFFTQDIGRGDHADLGIGILQGVEYTCRIGDKAGAVAMPSEKTKAHTVMCS